MRLIDADALMLHAEQYRCGRGEYSRMVDVWHIENAPTIDVENFVRYHMDEISRTIRYQMVEVDAHKPYCPNCGTKMKKDGDAPTIDYESLRPQGELIDKIASYLEQDGNWETLKACWKADGRSDELRELLHRAAKGDDA